MFTRFRLLAMLVAGVLVTAMLFGFAPGDEPEAKAALGPLQAVTVAAADFHPVYWGTQYENIGYQLVSNQPQVARIPFPAEKVVITSVRVRVYDNVDGEFMCIQLHRAEPAEGSLADELGQVCTTGASTTEPQTLTIPGVFTRIGRYHTAFMRAGSSSSSPDLRLYGATVFYRVVT